MIRTLALTTALVAAAMLVSNDAAAQGLSASGQSYESPRNWVIEARGFRFRPEIDSDPALGGASPYNDVFGKKSMWVFGAGIDYLVFKGFGSLGVGLAADYGVVYGHGLIARSGTVAPDLTTLKTVPIRALLTYRFDWLAQRYRFIPLAPYVKVGLAHTLWWVTNGTGDVASFGENRALGGKWGYQATAGISLLLNSIDPILGREFDQDFGVNAVYAFGELTRITGDNFGGQGFDLSDTAWIFGLTFEF